MIDRKVYGIGKMIIENIHKSTPILLPSLHFMVFQYDDGFEAYCLELNLSSFGSEDKIAVNDLSLQISDFIENIFSKGEKAKDILLNVVSDTTNSEYWAEYRKISFSLGLSGVSTDITTKLIEQMRELKNTISYYESLLELAKIVSKKQKDSPENQNCFIAKPINYELLKKSA
ncbi:MAG: hypothetical protein A2086_06000 [Spirochaetes bacterium GWD1_27_9]|nr:MAG: hypothetical protein A2Z98_10660 [Spirochaetes bacterium GWB1_27_13]OHD26214.1 MAG: hypothetical protein A2Y34_11145 [Spirochaetes bacterium GWC1_27_15]OHD35564.1 MAG: hypothetical protein A2086_06000 [Spirochaetes bacterium GWD1_27_9]